VERKKMKVGASFLVAELVVLLVFLSGDVEIFGDEEVGMCEQGRIYVQVLVSIDTGDL
jgi:hypothetical protein